MKPKPPVPLWRWGLWWVLLALGMSEDLARSCLRFGLGRFNTTAEVDRAVEIVSDAVKKLRGMG